jgi:CRISPR-associated protein Cas2
MVVIVTRDAAERVRGFLASCMLEIAAGVYTSPRMTAGVRERVWAVLAEWHPTTGGSIVMTWRDRQEPGGQGLRHLGEPPKYLVVQDDLHLVAREYVAARPSAPMGL